LDRLQRDQEAAREFIQNNHSLLHHDSDNNSASDVEISQESCILSFKLKIT
jgi:hypothetical protein